MKKIFYVTMASLVIGAAGFTGYKVYDNYQMSKYSYLMLENLELLTQLESWKDCGKNYMAPNGVIWADETQYHTTVTTDAEGNLRIGTKVEAGYEANKTYDVVYEKMNCKEWQGSCCDQRQVGIYIISTRRV